ncbi:hypothetical protein L6452_02261 [Arctium lappa]|uniref:Uncharacterized protein n=1 Tax=Arctium lappa TaxID=4217 RepID=A0ACB9FIY2_ARCLA|nr:hypothetical protein L6452_02261 [Arctium lappa]
MNNHARNFLKVPRRCEEGVGGGDGDGNPADDHGDIQETASIVADEGVGGGKGGISLDDNVVDGNDHSVVGLSYDLNAQIKSLSLKSKDLIKE